MIIRNDDVAFDTKVEHFQKFCSVCDQYGFKLLQGITPRGIARPIDVDMSNEQIKALGPDVIFADNQPVLQYLLSRDDLIGIHGLWHTHDVQMWELEEAQELLVSWGLQPTYFVPPFVGIFTEGEHWLKEVPGLKVVAAIRRLEDYLEAGIPADSVLYLHSWRFDGSFYLLKDLENCLERISAMT